ncbi:uncharacterized protein LOC124545011 [Schistocerca americana]|uniref:uncharacterized protein LOC124545011 n=1 Tax=Schistocerca americana TaxID=7009 RepID=UPI001F4FE9FE|nr:uncharacterized protein LOC124545011 [Schistocerca americana]XP_047097855.1 uncharacterized protein LOC124711698 [Schistocerca piceifrons]XP_049941548.1 uncharacterized protein LOC126418696 [Schistocerca serialis cubense]
MASDTGGVKPMPIAGRMVRERERLVGMTNEERAWRKQWLQDQILSPNEPRRVPELERELMNPIRRAYRKPLDVIFNALKPTIGERRAQIARYVTGKVFISLFAIYATTYYFKYNANDWTRKGGWRVLVSRKRVVPGDPEYPKLSDRQVPADYASRGFKNSPI